jgi:hypothetical protein
MKFFSFYQVIEIKLNESWLIWYGKKDISIKFNVK